MEITGKDIILATNDLPRLILLCGPCRTGTTALSNIFVRAGIESHMQPIKSIRRAKEEAVNGDPVKWIINKNSAGVIFSKETFGESHPSEFFNPVEDLIRIGYPREKINVVLILRDPRQTFASWKRMWGATDMEKLKQAFAVTEEVRQSCAKSGIYYSTMVHEAIRDNSSEVVASRLFSRLGLSGLFSCLIDWKETPKFGDSDPQNSHLLFYDSPPEKFISGVRDRGSYSFKELQVSPEDLAECMQCLDIFSLYNEFRIQCEKDLNIEIGPLIF